ncbi:MAG: type I secretion system permease/ATPase [Rhodospirillales bacterium]|nr:type I secretion system permease/ATPase [Rhodospirillales bacterium]
MKPGTAGSELLRRTARELIAAFGLASVLSAGLTLCALIVPLQNMEIYDRVLGTRSVPTLVALVLATLIGLAVYGGLEYLRGVVQVAMADRVARRLNIPVLQAAAAREARGAAGQAMRDLQELRLFVSGTAASTGFDLLLTPFLVLTLFVLHPAYGALVLGGGIVLLALNVLGEIVSRRSLVEASNQSAILYGDLASALRAAEAVTAMGMLPALARRWARTQAPMLRALHRGTRRARAVAIVARNIRILMTGAVVAVGVLLVLDRAATVGTLVAANLIAARTLLPFMGLAQAWRRWAFARAAYGRLLALLDAPAGRRDTSALPAPDGRLVVDRVTYIPPGVERPVLRGVSFTVEPGEVVGIIGPSGAGKSTLARILVGAAEPSSGGVYLDGHSTWRWEREDFGRHVGYLPQGISLLDGTIADNIARMQNADPADVVAAARRAGIHKTILALPFGYSTPANEAARTLSGGQRQRVALARALFGRPRLLVLDEPNANLDEPGEAALIEAIGSARAEGIAVVLIAHRPSIIATADKLIVLKDGIVDRIGEREEVIGKLGSAPARAQEGGPRLVAVS